MSKGLISIAADIVNTAWGVGEQVYKTVSDEVAESIKEEALRRTEKYCKKHNLQKGSEAYQAYLKKQKKEVANEYKSLAVKGGLIGLGFGFLM